MNEEPRPKRTLSPLMWVLVLIGSMCSAWVLMAWWLDYSRRVLVWDIQQRTGVLYLVIALGCACSLVLGTIRLSKQRHLSSEEKLRCTAAGWDMVGFTLVCLGWSFDNKVSPELHYGAVITGMMVVLISNIWTYFLSKRKAYLLSTAFWLIALSYSGFCYLATILK